MLKSTDPTRVIARPYYWSIIEINIGVLAASLPSLKPLVRRFLPRLLGESYYGRSSPAPGFKDSTNMSRSRSRGDNFNRFGGKRADRSEGSRDLYDDKWDMKNPIAVHEGSRVEMVPYHHAKIKSTDEQSQSHHSNESEEHILRKTPQSQIVRTIEISRSVQEDNQHGGYLPRADYYPGRAV
jgi:hypothetical protein